MGTPHLLPDSRLAAPRNTVMADYTSPVDGSVTRIEWEPYFCASCGKHCGHCTRENMTFLFYLCTPCFDKHGTIAGTCAVPDDEFWAKVQEEMRTHYGRDLTAAELAVMSEADLPEPLRLLIRESPTRAPR